MDILKSILIGIGIMLGDIGITAIIAFGAYKAPILTTILVILALTIMMSIVIYIKFF